MKQQPERLDYAPPSGRDNRFERNGWIGLLVTLAVCAGALALFAAIAVLRIAH